MTRDRETVAGDDRRRLLKLLIRGSGAVIGAVTVLPALGLMVYPVIAGAARRRRKVLFVTPADATSGTFIAARYEGQEAAAPGIFVRMAGGRPEVLSARCTHAGCSVNWVPEQSQFVCPCHQGRFDATGKNVSGPPPKPLERLIATSQGSEIYIQEPQA